MEHRMNADENDPVTHVTDGFVIGVTRARARARDGDTEGTRHMRHTLGLALRCGL